MIKAGKRGGGGGRGRTKYLGSGLVKKLGMVREGKILVKRLVMGATVKRVGGP